VLFSCYTVLCVVYSTGKLVPSARVPVYTDACQIVYIGNDLAAS